MKSNNHLALWGLMAAAAAGRIKFEDENGLEASVKTLVKNTTEVLDKANKQEEETRKLHSKIDGVSSAWQADLNTVKATIETLKTEGRSVDPEAIRGVIVTVLDREFAERRARGVIPGSEGAQLLEKIADPWNRAVDYFGYKAKHMVSQEAQSGEDKKAVGAFLRSAAMATPSNDLHRSFIRQASDVWLLDAWARAICKRTGEQYDKKGGFAAYFPKTAEKWVFYQNALLEANRIKATVDPIDTATSPGGGYWVPVGFTNELRELLFLETRVPAFFEMMLFDTKSLDIPLDLTDQYGDFVPEILTYTDAIPYVNSDPQRLGQIIQDQKKTLTPKKFRVRFMLSNEVTEQAMVNMLPWARRKLLRSHANTAERVAINGQATTIDTGDVPGTYDCRKPISGIRHYCEAAQANSKYDFGGTDLSYKGLVSGMPLKFGERATDINRQVYIAGVASFHRMLELAEVKTMDLLGSQAVIINGALATIAGRAIVVSREVRGDLNATGIFDNSVLTKTIVILVHRDGFIFGENRSIDVYEDRLVPTDVIDVCSFRQFDFGAVFPTTYKMAVVGYNFANA